MKDINLSIRKQLVTSFMGVGSMRLLSIPLTLGASVILARFLGPEQFGQYAFIMALIPLLALPMTGGMRNLLTREIAAYSHESNWSLYNGALRAAHGWVLLVSLASLLLYVLFGPILDVVPSSGKWRLLPIAILILPLLGLNAVRTGIIKGLRLPATAELPETLIKPCAVLLFLAIFALTFELTGETAVWVQVLSAGVAVVIATLIFVKVNPAEANGVAPTYEIKPWLVALTPFTLLTLIGTFNAQIGILALGILGSDDQVAGLRVAERGAHFVNLSLAVVNLIISPHIVRAYKNQDFQLLQKLSQQSARGAFIIALPIALFLIVFGEWLIGVLFGTEYAELGYLPLVILVIGQLFNVFFGAVGFLLAMTGHEKQSFKGQFFAVLISLVLCTLLIPFMGAVGAAIAVSASVITWNAILGYLVFKKIGIRPSAL